MIVYGLYFHELTGSLVYRYAQLSRHSTEFSCLFTLLSEVGQPYQGFFAESLFRLRQQGHKIESAESDEWPYAFDKLIENPQRHLEYYDGGTAATPNVSTMLDDVRRKFRTLFVQYEIEYCPICGDPITGLADGDMRELCHYGRDGDFVKTATYCWSGHCFEDMHFLMTMKELSYGF